MLPRHPLLSGTAQGITREPTQGCCSRAVHIYPAAAVSPLKKIFSAAHFFTTNSLFLQRRLKGNRIDACRRHFPYTEMMWTRSSENTCSPTNSKVLGWLLQIWLEQLVITSVPQPQLPCLTTQPWSGLTSHAAGTAVTSPPAQSSQSSHLP